MAVLMPAKGSRVERSNSRIRQRSTYGGTVPVGPIDPGDPGNGGIPVTQYFYLTSTDPAVPLATGHRVMFGLPFKAGDVGTTSHVAIELADGTAITRQQYDHEPTPHSDGSLKYASFTVVLPSGVSSQSVQLRATRVTGAKSQAPSGLSFATLSGADYKVEVDICTPTTDPQASGDGAGSVVTWTGNLADALADGRLRVTGDGPAGKRFTALIEFRDPSNAASPDLWLKFHGVLYWDGEIDLMPACKNGWLDFGVNYFVRAARFKRGSTILRSFTTCPAGYVNYGVAPNIFLWTFHSEWYFADAAGWHYQSHATPQYTVKIDPVYGCAALALPPYPSWLGSVILPPSQTAYSETQPKGYQPSYFPGDPAGIEQFLGNAGDPGTRGDLGYNSSYEVAYLVTGSAAWASYSRVTSLCRGSCQLSYVNQATGMPPVLVPNTYAGMPAPDTTLCTTGATAVPNPDCLTNLIVESPVHGVAGRGWTTVNGTNVAASYVRSGGWHGTDFNAASIGGGLKSPAHAHDHFSPPGYIVYLVEGREWHHEGIMRDGVHAVLVAPGTVAFRNPVIGGTAYYGLVKHTQVRGIGWSIRDMDNAAWLCPATHPARRYLDDSINANTAYFKIAMDVGYIPQALIDIGFIANDPTDNNLCCRSNTYHNAHLGMSMTTAYRRGRQYTAEFWAVFRKGVFAGAQSWGDMYRAGGNQFGLKATADATAPYYTQSQLEIGQGVQGSPTSSKVPFVPTAGRPGNGLMEDGARLPWANDIINDPDQPWANAAGTNHGWLGNMVYNRNGSPLPGMSSLPGQIRQTAAYVRFTGIPLAAADAIVYDDYFWPNENAAGFTRADYALTPRYAVRGVDSSVPSV